jgi:predicted dehydrogenase
MRRLLLSGLSLCLFAAGAMAQVRLIIVEPGHFHSALITRDMYPQVSPRVNVYSTLGPELVDYVNRVAQFNTRADNPTRWELEMHTGANFFDRMLSEKAGNVVVFSGKNREKIGRIIKSLEAGYNVLADKPWIIASQDLPKLAAALDLAEKKGLVGYDVMTERWEVTSILQKEIVNSPEVFGELVPGTPAQPAIVAKSIHYLMKTVAGVPLKRPTWFLNIDEVGEGMADVGTHVIDLVQWSAFPKRQLDYRTDVKMLTARRWPTVLSKAQFERVTGEKEFSAHLAPWVKNGQLDYFANHEVKYTAGGVHIALDIEWGWEAEPGAGDVYEATFRGTRALAEIRQGKAEKFRPELYVVPNSAADREAVFAGLRKKIDALQKNWPGVGVSVRGTEAQIVIPDKYRVGHEAHFAEVTRAFLGYLKDPKSLPAWEKSNMLVKYAISTKGVELSRQAAR